MGEAGVLLDKLGDSVGTFIGKLGKIAAPIAIVTALGVAFVKLKERIDGTSTALKERETAQKNFNTELEREIEIRKRAGYEEEELIQFEIAKLEIRNQQLKQTNTELQAQNDLVSQNAQAAQSAAGAFGGAVAAHAAYSGVSKSSNVNVGANTKVIKENTQEINDNKTAIENLKNQLDIIEQARKLAAKRTEKETENVKEQNIEIERTIALVQTTGLDNSMVRLSDMVTNILNRKDEFISACIEIQKVGNEQFEILKNTAELLGESSLGLGGAWVNSISDFQKLFNETMDVVVKKGKTGWQSYAQVASSGLQAVGTLLNNLSEEQDATTEEGFEKQKKLQISATVMNMLSGIMAAWTSSMALPAPASFITGGIQTAATAALGAAQIAKIKSTSFGGDSGAIGNVNSGAVSSMVIPPVQYSNAVQGANTQGAITSQRVYVTETDIVNTINKVNVQEMENTY
jgi:hypothetical protein